MFTLNCQGKLVTIKTPLVMGIVNATPDSFFAGSRAMDQSAVREVVGKMLNEGADIIDIGGQSTRPGSERISAEEEIARITPAIQTITENFPAAIISIDTFYADVAKKAVEAGASIVNNISGGDLDEAMLACVASLKVPYICMHMRGTPQSMTRENQYDNLPLEVVDYFISKIRKCRKAGIKDVIIDPGFGFAKNAEQNFLLLKNLSLLKILNVPVLVGLSRKSTICKTLNITAAEALNGTTVMHTLSLLNGANILRVHDVKEAKEAITLVSKYIDSGKS